MKKLKRLIYILNQYSPQEASHFHHVLHLLDVLAEQEGIDVTLIIEKASEPPVLANSRIDIVLQTARTPLTRFLELRRLVRSRIVDGATQVFVRISTFGALAAISGAAGTSARVHYWNSGTTIAHDRSRPFGMAKLKWYLRSRLPFLLTKTLVHRFVTGPESMVDYYVDVARVDRRKIRVLYNDIDVQRFAPVDAQRRSALRAQWGVLPGEQLVLFVHRLSPVKRTLFYLPHVLEAVFQSADLGAHTRVLIVGGGAEETDLARLLAARPYAERVRMLGRVANKDIHALYQAADVFMNPTYEEGFPRVLLEAMASGLPIVTTDAGGIGDLLGPCQRAYMVDKDDRDGFSAQLVALLRSRDDRQALAAENVQHVQRFSSESVARMYAGTLFS